VNVRAKTEHSPLSLQSHVAKAALRLPSTPAFNGYLEASESARKHRLLNTTARIAHSLSTDRSSPPPSRSHENAQPTSSRIARSNDGWNASIANFHGLVSRLSGMSDRRNDEFVKLVGRSFPKQLQICAWVTAATSPARLFVFSGGPSLHFHSLNPGS
jgi:hypothetical protein